jgi:DNA-binding response OmpR family regulator
MRLLLVEDNERLSALVARGLGEAGFQVDVLATMADARQALATTRYAVIVLDLGLSDGDGMELLRGLRSEGSAIPVLVLTARGGLKDRVNGLHAGADDYLPKPFALDELVARLRALLRRPGQLLGSALQLSNLTFDTGSKQLLVDGQPRLLSARETGVLEVLMQRPGHVVPKRVVEDHLFGLDNEVGSNAVEVYVHRLRKQLTESGAKVRIHTVRGVGYLIGEAP